MWDGGRPAYLVFAALAACDPSDDRERTPAGSASNTPGMRAPAARAAGPSRKAPAARASARDSETGDDTARPPATALPRQHGVTTPFKAPKLRVESGPCWLRLLRLDASVIEDTRAEFIARNPTWEVGEDDIDPFTGLVQRARRKRGDSEIGPTSTLTDAEYKRRRAEPLLHNADLLGLRKRDIASIEWPPGGFRGSAIDLSGTAAYGRLRGSSELEFGWTVHVNFQRDGVVSSILALQRQAPIAICTTPAFSAERAQAAAAAREDNDPKTSASLRAIEPDRSRTPELAIETYTDGNKSDRTAASRTWRLVWRVRSSATFLFFDATSGELLFKQPAKIR
jgi:hypothetical protein